MSTLPPQTSSSSSREAQFRRVSKLPRTSILNLDDDSLLSIFYLSRPSFFMDDGYGNLVWGDWGNERWWYKLVQVCRRWRGLILGSASYLDLCLVCTHGTPVADMLAHSPPFPLIINHGRWNYDLTAEDEEGILLALQHRDRVCRIRLLMPVASLRKVITAIDDEFPVLAFLQISACIKHNAPLVLPSTFEAPHLRHLALDFLASPIGSRLLVTAIGLVSVILRWIHPSTYPHPNHLLQTLSLLPQLENLDIGFSSPVPNRDLERQWLNMPITTQATLPNLHLFAFWGVSAYLEALLPHMTTPLLERFNIHFFHQLSFSVPRLLQFMTTIENLRFSSTQLIFHHSAVSVFAYSRVRAGLMNFSIEVICGHLDWQASSMAQIFNILSPLFSEVVELILLSKEHSLSSALHNQTDHTQWRELLGSFRNVKTIRVHNGLVGEVSRSLQSDGERPLELPELKELVCPAGCVEDKTFSTFIHEREVAGQPVNLIGEAFPVGRIHYQFISSTGLYFIDPDPDPLP